MRVRQAVGRFGEHVAADHLVADGMRVLERNWRCRLGEIDIVALDGECLVICEVKTRRSLAFGFPVESVTPAKLARLRRLAAGWLDTCDRGYAEIRIDVISVTFPRGGRPEVEHLRAVG